MNLVIDRIEGEYAVCELLNNGVISNIDIPLILIPKAAEGDKINVDIEDQITSITLNKEYKENKELELKAKYSHLWD